MPVNENDTHVIRPSGRHLLTIGRELIQDPSAAILELVKNAYDADSQDVSLVFQAHGDDDITITVEDHGHGMTRETVLGAWLVPSTSDKRIRNESPKGRIMQGRKGVGRFAASILGNELDLETVAESGERTRLHMDWSVFENAVFLDDVRIPVTTDHAESSSGTKMTMTGSGEFRSMWNEKLFRKLRTELKKLVAPTAVLASDIHAKDDFILRLHIEGFGDSLDWDGTVEPFPVFELYDYRIFGTVDATGKVELCYHQNKFSKNSVEERIAFDLTDAPKCGRIEVDIRVFDRESSSIGSLIQRGLKDEAGNYVGKLEAQRLLNESCGIGVYRNGFRIRPLGDPEFDWLKLNHRRVQNPSMCIGSNQVIGFVRVQSEDMSGLIEKSARDGLMENDAYEALKAITGTIIARLEARRFDLRKKAGLSRKVVRVEETLEKFFSLRDVRTTIGKRLSEHNVEPEIIASVMQDMDAAERDKARQAEEVLKEFSIYQAHASLGKLINIILHETRIPLSYIRNNAKSIDGFYRLYKNNGNFDIIEKEVLPAIMRLPEKCETLSDLFRRLDPLSSDKREQQKDFLVGEQLRRIIDLFALETKKHGIEVQLIADARAYMHGWVQDIDSIFSNLLDNSIYWINETSSAIKRVRIEIVSDDMGKTLHVDYRDTGPGIDETFIAGGTVFDPGFSMKPHGHGLGLAIAGEASRRLGFDLKALANDKGVWFRMESLAVTEQEAK